MSSVQKQSIPQVSSNLTTDSDRVQASVVDAGPKDCGGEPNAVEIDVVVSHEKSGGFVLPTPKPLVLGLGLVPPTHPQRSGSEGDLPSITLRLETPQYMRLGFLIKKLTEFVEPKNNVHKVIKKLAASIQTVYDQLGKELHTASNQTQTSPITQRSWAQTCAAPDKTEESQNRSNTNKRKASSSQDNHLRNVKRAQRRLTTVNPTPPITNRNAGETKKNQMGRQGIPPQAIPNPEQERQKNQAETPAGAARTEEHWQLADRRKKKAKKKKAPSKPRRKPLPPNSLVVHKARDETTYAAIIEKVKADPALKDIEQKVEKMRKTAGGNLLIIGDEDPGVRDRNQRPGRMGEQGGSGQNPERPHPGPQGNYYRCGEIHKEKLGLDADCGGLPTGSSREESGGTWQDQSRLGHSPHPRESVTKQMLQVLAFWP
ncbi:hypothetical protein PV326_011178 [Microctonus aethiopoides]|nr:hypothetical protein PV326_011178 [Microctonus aethiopoides]